MHGRAVMHSGTSCGPAGRGRSFLRADDLRTGKPRWAAEAAGTEPAVIGTGESWAVTRDESGDIQLYRW